MAEKIINGMRCFDKPFEICWQVAPGWWTDEGCFDMSDEDDERFRENLKKIMVEEKKKSRVKS